MGEANSEKGGAAKLEKLAGLTGADTSARKPPNFQGFAKAYKALAGAVRRAFTGAQGEEAKSENGGAAWEEDKPDYSSIRVVSGFYIERDVDALIDHINKSGILRRLNRDGIKSVGQSEQDYKTPHRSSEESMLRKSPPLSP